MSPSVQVIRRAKVDGKWRWVTTGRVPRDTEVRWIVRYRLRGRGAPIHGGSFRTKAEAELRATWIRHEISAGRVPDLTLRATDSPLTAVQVLDDYRAAREGDVGPSRIKTMQQTRAHLGDLADRPAETIRMRDVEDWVRTRKLAPKSIAMHLGVMRAAWRRAEIHPNPWEAVRAPKRDRSDKATAPSWREWAAIREQLPRRHRDPADFIEDTGLRISELEALTWGDIDLDGHRFRVIDTKTKHGDRWVPLRDGLHAWLDARVPQEDRRPSDPVFPGFVQQTFRGALARACTRGRVPAYSPHDLRHRYGSRMVAAGVPLPIAVEVFGHANPTLFLNTYSHVLVDEPRDRSADLYRAVMRIYATPQHDAPGMHNPSTAHPTNAENPAHGRVSVEVEDIGLK